MLRSNIKRSFSLSAVTDKIRNIAIIAHVDHGKTTLVDGLLKGSGLNHQVDRLMDSGDLEQEKGITIVSKVTSLNHKDHVINIVDTPGHQDFGGEVERILSMVDGVLLLVCATEGTMRQTKYVLEKAIANNLKPIVIINKIDRSSARIDEVEEEVLELFFDMNMDEDFINYKTFFTSAKLFAGFETIEEVQDFVKRGKGKTVEEMTVDAQSKEGISKILDYIIEHVDKPKLLENSNSSPKMLVSQIEMDIIYGKIVRGKLSSGKLSVGDSIASFNKKSKLVEKSKILKMFKSDGIDRKEILEAYAGDIISFAGLTKTMITDTISLANDPCSIESPEIDKPMVCVEIFINNGPLAGQSYGAKMAFNELLLRIKYESEKDLALKMKIIGSTKVLLFGRGELHIGVVLEHLRREGFEMLVSCPKITMKLIEGVKYEPIEITKINCDLKHVSLVMDRLMSRKAEIVDQVPLEEDDRQQIVAEIPARGLLGLQLDLLGLTKNSISMTNHFKDWEKHKGPIEKKRKNSIVSSQDGNSTSYAINGLEKFGNFFIAPGEKIYRGQVVGVSLENEENVNVCKEKKLTNIRSAGNDENIKLIPPTLFTIEEAISFIGEDEWLEITRENLRIRKIELNKDVRKTLKKRKKEDNDLIIKS